MAVEATGEDHLRLMVVSLSFGHIRHLSPTTPSEFVQAFGYFPECFPTDPYRIPSESDP